MTLFPTRCAALVRLRWPLNSERQCRKAAIGSREIAEREYRLCCSHLTAVTVRLVKEA